MSKQGAKTTLLAVGSLAAIVLSFYLAYRRQRSPVAAARPGRAPMDPTAGPGAEQTDRDRVSGPVGDLRERARTTVGDLASASRRVTGEGRQTLARFHLGEGGRRLPEMDDIDLRLEDHDAAPRPARPQEDHRP
jgi:hypothetical protein